MTTSEHDTRIQRALHARLIAHLFRDQRLVLLGHLTFAALLSVILWGLVQKAVLGGWVIAVLGTSALRALWPRPIAFAAADDAATLRRVRLAVLVNGLAWGVGAAVVIARLPPAESVDVLIVLFALVIGSVGTLAADPPAFKYFLGGVGGPLPLGLFARGFDVLHFAVAACVATLMAIPIVRYRHGHRALVGLLRAATLSAENEQTLLRELQAALGEVKTLRGWIRICANCKRVNTDEGGWEQFESYVKDHSDVEFSHGICPDCARQWSNVDLK